MLGIGIDITRISRFNEVTQAYLEKTLTESEILEYNIAINKPLFLAARWAIKEALYKADNQYFHFNKVEIKVENSIYVFPGYKISTSTEDDYYIAFVQKENENERKD